jgi:hypothetical protein
MERCVRSHAARSTFTAPWSLIGMIVAQASTATRARLSTAPVRPSNLVKSQNCPRLRLPSKLGGVLAQPATAHRIFSTASNDTRNCMFKKPAIV